MPARPVCPAWCDTSVLYGNSIDWYFWGAIRPRSHSVLESSSYRLAAQYLRA